MTGVFIDEEEEAEQRAMLLVSTSLCNETDGI